MYSIAFPNMFSGSKTNLTSDHEATSQNLILMLKSDRTALFGDPYFGTALKSMIFEQNSVVLKDLVIDEIYTSIITFMPQILVNRNDIQVTSDGVAVYVKIKCTNLIDYTTDLYNIKLTMDDEG